MSRFSRIVFVSLLVLGLALAATPSFAQTSTGDITGVVTDQTGAVIPNATVVVTNQGTNVGQTVQTDATGIYRVGLLQPGRYSVKTSAQGFKTIEKREIEVTVGFVSRIDVKMEVGAVAETVTVEASAPLVNSESGRLSELVGEARIANLPLNGRNIYNLVRLAPGAVYMRGNISENGASTSVNGARVNFNGFLLDGIANKGLSGGFNSQPNPDMVQEFRVETNNLSAEFGNSAGAITSVVTKSGTNSFHGTAWEYLRNNKLDAAEFFEHTPAGKPAFRYNQFGATIGGPIIKDKTFFFGAYEGARTRIGQSSVFVVETPQWRDFVTQNFPNSVAALLYKTFPFKGSIKPGSTLTRDDVIGNSGLAGSLADYTDPDFVGAARAAQFRTLFSRLPANLPLEGDATLTGSSFKDATGTFFNGNQYSGRVDHNIGTSDRIFGRFTWASNIDPNAGDLGLNNRGFGSPNKSSSPNLALGWTHVFGPNLINEFRAGYSRGVGLQQAAFPGVPEVDFDDGQLGFGAYNGYPQFFIENVFNYQDIVSLKKGRHNLKMGFEVKRNQENSEFNVGRADYEVGDIFFFAVDAPYFEVAGTDPGRLTGVNNDPPALSSNIRGWRNTEYGAFLQDDWKVTPRLTLNLGLRYDLYQRHTEKYNLATQFVFGPGNNITERIRNITGPLAGVGGSQGGFAKAPVAGNTAGDHNNFGPRFGFAWDPFGKGRTAIRGGYGVSYESTFYNAISNSRWNPPYYNFAQLFNDLAGGTDFILYGPPAGQAPRFDGPPGTGNKVSPGNLMGYDPRNTQLLAFLTGIPNPQMKDPYVHSYFLGIEQQFGGSYALKVNYVGSSGHKLFRSDNINRLDGGRLFRRLGDTNFGPTGQLNKNFGVLRTWQNSVNSNYNSLQASLQKRMTRGLEFNLNYTWSHSIDEGSTWHSHATTSNGRAGGDGYLSSAGNLRLDRGPSLFDIRHRFTSSWVYELPFFRQQQGFVGHVLGGWQFNGLVALQTGAPFSVFDRRNPSLSCTGTTASTCVNRGGDYNLDGERIDRPNAPIVSVHTGPESRTEAINGFLKRSDFGVPGLAQNGSLGRNTFRWPGYASTDFSFFKNIKIREGMSIQFRTEMFNILNRVNFLQTADSTHTNNQLASPELSKSRKTHPARQIQFGLKFIF